MKTKLVSINRNNILFMPILSINTKGTNVPFGSHIGKFDNAFGGYYVLADEFTAKKGNLNNDLAYRDKTGIIMGYDRLSEDFILVDQGINGGGDLNIKTPFPTDLIETAYMVKLDHRLLRLDGKTSLDDTGPDSFAKIDHSFVDDDGIATYYIAQGDIGFSAGTDRSVDIPDTRLTQETGKEVFEGPLGTRLAIAPRSSLNVRQSDGLFTELGTAATDSEDNPVFQALQPDGTGGALGAHKFIDTIMNVVGVTTGYSLDIPIRIFKKDR
tara:strand:- start:108 stop:914 length:807 start_codon:yes stop_codon:yes gene_type:complete